MSSSLRRGVLAAAVIAFPIAALAACGAGADAATDEVRPDNAYAQVEDIKIQNVNVILSEDDGLAGISARLFNNGPDDQTLEEIRLPGTRETVVLTPAEGESRVVVPAGGDLVLGGEGHASAVIEDPSARDIALGNAQRLVFDLSETGGIDLRARVVDDSEGYGHYAGWGPTPTADPTLPPEGEDEGEDGEGDEGSGESPDPEETSTDGTTDESTDESTGESTESTDESTDGTADESTDVTTDGSTDGGTTDEVVSEDGTEDGFED